MSVRVRDVMMEHLGALRYEPTDARIRAMLGDRTVVDSTRALLVWEPKRVVPTYAVPDSDVVGELEKVEPAETGAALGVAAMGALSLGGRAVYDPSIPFAVHTTDGESLVVRVPGIERGVDAFRPADADLTGYVLLDFDGFDAWFHEDELNVAHPRDPFHRVDVLHSSRHVRVELAGTVLAESSTPCMLFEPPLPPRYYFTADEVRMDLLQPSERLTSCAYKGEASYWSAPDEPDLAWCYRAPLRDASEITGRIAFFSERVDVYVDGERQERPITPWSRPQ
jgi:uncharacterized protein (DUF427 family)